ncbi:MAG: M48 family metallopeptidase [Micavibrio sp.]
MSLPAKGLQTEIWNNNLKSLFLLGLYPFILAAVFFAAIAAFGYFSGHAATFQNGVITPDWGVAGNYAMAMTVEYWPLILTVVAIWFIVAYFFQTSMIRAMAHSHPVTRKEEPALYNLVENMCIATGTKIPRIEIIETHARNAFASGVNEATYCITVTRGLMQSLEKDELEAVLAHELAHILNRDVRLLIVCIIFTGMLGVMAQLVWSNLRYALWVPRSSGGGRRNGANGYILLLAIAAILWVGYMATVMTRFAISRRREFMADAGAVQITKNPDAMMRALIRISGAADIPKAPQDIKAMCFENKVPFLGLFATHPPIERRVKVISDYSGLPVPTLPPKISADNAFQKPAARRDNWTTRERFRSRRNANPWG